MQRIGVVGIVLQADKEQAKKVQDLLSQYADIIVGRMGVPIKEHGVNTISVIFKGSNEDISALSGKLGKLNGVSVKSAITSVEIE